VSTPRQDLFYLPVLHFCKRKKLTFLFKIVSLWHFHECMYYNPNWFISIFLLSTIVSFFWWLQQVKKSSIHSWIESTSTIFTFLTSFFHLPLSCVTSP
jgi:hypothetical protein